jgi:hypothetical protein
MSKTAASDGGRPRTEQEARFQEFLAWREKQQSKKP